MGNNAIGGSGPQSRAEVRTLIIFALTIISIAIISIIFIPGAEGRTITVGRGEEDYRYIQDAINASRNGDRIMVSNGVYSENLIINQSITLQAVNTSGGCVISGQEFGNVITIETDGVVVQGFTVQDSASEYPYAGIYVQSADNTIWSNEIRYNTIGIYLESSHDNWISLCNINNNDHDGVVLTNSDNNLILNNEISNNFNNGITLIHSTENVIEDNFMKGNSFRGMELQNSHSNILHANTISRSGLMGCYSHNSDENNFTWNNISGNAGYGLSFYSLSKAYVAHNALMNNSDKALAISSADESWIVDNEIYMNDGRGIEFLWVVDMEVVGNSIHDNNGAGITVSGSNNVLISDNTLTRNRIGIDVTRNSIAITAELNEMEDNSEFGLRVIENGNHTVHAEDNWWGHISGPFHTTRNPEGRGDNITDLADFDPWTGKEELQTVYVDDDAPDGGNGLIEHPYNRIQDALDNSSNVLKVRILEGNYSESIIVNRSVTLQGNGTGSTIITGSDQDHPVIINADHVNITGISFINPPERGIYFGGVVVNGNHTWIHHNEFRDMRNYSIGIHGYSHNTIERNTFTNISAGILIWDSEDNSIKSNTFNQSSSGLGINLYYANSTRVRFNTFDLIGTGIEMSGDSRNNLVEWGLFTNLSNTGIRSSVGTNLTIRWVQMYSVPTGISLNNSPESTLVEYCHFWNNGYGIILGGKGSHHVKNCSFQESDIAGIRIDSNNNNISGNIFEKNSIGITVSSDRSRNAAIDNEFLDNEEYGIQTYGTGIGRIDAQENWWGDNSGPYHETDNPGGLGDNVTDLVDYRPWLKLDPDPDPHISISGIITDSDTGLPVVNCLITLTDTCGTDVFFRVTNTTGYYEIIDAIPKGDCNWSIAVSKAGYGTITTFRILQEDMTIDLNLSKKISGNSPPVVMIISPLNNSNVSRDFEIHGVAFDPDGSPIFVEYRMGNGSWILVVDETPENFSLSLRDMDYGNYSFQFRSSDGEDESSIFYLNLTVVKERKGGGGWFSPGPVFMAGGIVMAGFLVIIGLAHYREDFRMGLIGLVLIPLIAKLNRHQSYRDDRYKDVFDYIRKNPGTTYTSMNETLKIPDLKLVYDLNGLENEGMIRSVNQFGTIKFYYNENYEHEKKLRSLPPMTRVEQAILDSLRKLGPAARCEIQATLKLTPQDLAQSISMLQQRELVGSDGEGKWAFCWAMDKKPRKPT